MKRFMLNLALAFSLLFAPAMACAGSASAVDIFNVACSGAASSSDACSGVNGQGSSTKDPIIGFIRIIIEIVAFIVGIASVIVIIVAGIRMVTSGGDSNGMAGARRALLYAIIGLIVAVLAQTLVAFVLVKLG